MRNIENKLALYRAITTRNVPPLGKQREYGVCNSHAHNDDTRTVYDFLVFGKSRNLTKPIFCDIGIVVVHFEDNFHGTYFD
jgi:hypothetical protein